MSASELPAIKRAGPHLAGPTQFDWFDATGPTDDGGVSHASPAEVRVVIRPGRAPGGR